MDNTYLHRQSNTQPLFDDILWSQPERRDSAGKLAIIGGNSHGFSSVSETFAAANTAGIGVARVLLPDSLSKTVGKLWPESEFASSTKIGSFSLKALNDWLAMTNWADATLISGDLGHNSETAILLDNFMEKETGHITLTGDSIELMTATPLTLLNREDGLLLVPDFSQFQKFLTGIRYPMALKSSMTLFQVAELLHSLTLNYRFAVIFIHDNQTLVAYDGTVSTTPSTQENLLATASAAAVWRLQQPSRPFEALTTAVFMLNRV